MNELPPRLRFKFCPLCGRPLGTKTDDHLERPHCAACHWTHYPVTSQAACVVVEHAGGIVLLKRAIPPDAGIWHLPIGHLEFGEAPGDAALREGSEETGLELVEPVLLDVHHGPGYGDPRDWYTVYCYRTRSTGGELRLDAENSEAVVAPPDSLPALKWTSNLRAVAAWRAWTAGRPYQPGRPLDAVLAADGGR